MAYLDPGTGNFLIQLLIGGFLGIGIFLKIYWSKITGLFKKKNNEEDQPPPVYRREKSDK